MPKICGRQAAELMTDDAITVSEPLTVSIVIPILGDLAPLRRLLDRIHRLDPPPGEIICVDLI